ncbi:unnamed protein product [Linum tenue]|uniref:Uncharacterized protein n=1 Tax=Linum tenue TaxID=586396 RepID=A0AAV0MZZ2_9ROSI|nr:unnamed protein product [Linum tenue]CAI0451855.1 unnamed protein product [Linum tenue]
MQETSSAQYILQQYTAASGGQRLQGSIHNAYAMGKVRMIASEFETANKVTKNRGSSKTAESGGFVLWQMNPDMWYVELALGGSKLEDSHLTRIQNNGGDAVYWETTINSFLDDYRPVDGVMIAHSGRSVVTLFRFGDTAMSHTRTRMEEAWVIEEVAFNVPGLSMDCFIPPAELRFASVSETCELPHTQRVVKPAMAPAGYQTRVAALERDQEGGTENNVRWTMDD